MRPRVLIPLLLALPLDPCVLAAQDRLLNVGSIEVSPTVEQWSFAGAGLIQPTYDGTSTITIRRAYEWSFPLNIEIPLGSAVTIDATATYADGVVRLSQRDPTLGTDHYTLSGVSDVRARIVWRALGDNIVATVGVNAPSGGTSLSPTQESALRVLAAPALAFETPVLGLGSSVTGGLVLAQHVGQWSFAAGGSYEWHTSYVPVAEIAGIVAPSFTPSNIAHVTLGTDALFGQHSMTVTASADFYSEDQLTSTNPPTRSTTQLGPSLTGAWQLSLTVPGFRELSLFATERYRSEYKLAGATVPGTSGHYADAGINSMIAAGRTVGVLIDAAFRYQTGLTGIPTVAAAGERAGVATLGLSERVGGFAILEFVRGQLATLHAGGSSTTATGIAAGLTIAQKF